MPKRTLTYALFLLFAFVLCYQVIADNRRHEEDLLRQTEVYMRVRDLVKRHYVDEVEDEKLFYGALRGMLGVLDPYSQFLTPEEYREMQIDTHGEFGGLGIEITIEDDWLTVITPLLGTPAYRAGVMAGDKIIRIEGRSTKGVTLLEAVQKLRGKPNTSVTITVLHKSAPRSTEITIVRGLIEIESVRFAQIIDDEYKIGYVKLVNFQDDTTQRLSEEVKALKKQGLRALVLDLRANPGGLLNQAVGVTNLFVRKGVIVSTRGRVDPSVATHGDDSVYRADRGVISPDLPLAVLINESSASASEIVAAALHDNNRAVLVGAKSYGKGSVQTIMDINLGPRKVGAIKLTTAKYYTPADVSIHGVGITPDLPVDMPPERIRAVYEQEQAEWIKRNSREAPDSGDENAPPPSPPAAAADENKPAEPPVVDIQREKAVEYLHEYLSRGEDAARAFVERHKLARESRKHAKADPPAEAPATASQSEAARAVERELPRGKPAPVEIVPTK